MAQVESRPGVEEGGVGRALKSRYDCLLALGADGNIAGVVPPADGRQTSRGDGGYSPIYVQWFSTWTRSGRGRRNRTGRKCDAYCGSSCRGIYAPGTFAGGCLHRTIKRIARQDPRGVDLSINFVALDKQGRYGAAGTGNGFGYSVATKSSAKIAQRGGNK